MPSKVKIFVKEQQPRARMCSHMLCILYGGLVENMTAAVDIEVWVKRGQYKAMHSSLEDGLKDHLRVKGLSLKGYLPHPTC
jgi:ABC-type uncharacterized transport system ATPase component